MPISIFAKIRDIAPGRSNEEEDLEFAPEMAKYIGTIAEFEYYSESSKTRFRMLPKYLKDKEDWCWDITWLDFDYMLPETNKKRIQNAPTKSVNFRRL